METKETTPEWSYIFDAENLEGLQTVSLEPSEEEKQRLARRLGIPALERLKADLRLENTQGGRAVHVSGKFQADILQNCVVTDEPIKTRIEENFEAWFADESHAVPLARARQKKLLEKGSREVQMIEEHEDPETMTDGQIDLGELVTQYLSLAINPYPRKEGAHYKSAGPDENEAASLSFKNPFAALKDWKTRAGKKE